MDDNNDANEKRNKGHFQPGVSGNPNGRPVGSRNKLTESEQVLLQSGPEITAKLAELAKEGDAVALTLAVRRIIPIARQRSIIFDLPEITTVADAAHASNVVLTAVGKGDLSPDEGSKLQDLVAKHIKIMEARDTDSRLRALEEALERNKQGQNGVS
jgi:Family of unknown function (DUF5681)